MLKSPYSNVDVKLSNQCLCNNRYFFHISQFHICYKWLIYMGMWALRSYHLTFESRVSTRWWSTNITGKWSFTILLLYHNCTQFYIVIEFNIIKPRPPKALVVTSSVIFFLTTSCGNRWLPSAICNLHKLYYAPLYNYASNLVVPYG